MMRVFLVVLLIVAPLGVCAQVNLDSGLVALYQFDGNFLDAGPSGFDGSSIGNAGFVDGAVVLGDNDVDAVSIPGSVLNGINSFSLSSEVKISVLHSSGPNAGNFLISGARSGQDNAFYIFYDSRSGQEGWKLGIEGTGAASVSVFDPNTQIENLEWLHVAFVREGSNVSLYVDGILQGNSVPVNTATLNIDESGLILGQEQESVGGGFDGSQSWAGSLNNLRFYDRALTSDEVNHLHTTSSFRRGTVSGFVYANGETLPGVVITLLDTAGAPVEEFAPDTTDLNGQFAFTEVVPDSYEVSIVTPLGYDIEPDDNPKGILLSAAEIVSVDFDLTEIVATNSARGPRYWQHVINSIIRGRSCQITEEEFLTYIDEVHEHYSPHYGLFDTFTTVQDWKSVFNKPSFTSDFEKARGQLGALVLNMVSQKIGQYTVVSEDTRTCGDVIAYCSELLEDSIATNDVDARFYASQVNRQISLLPGLIPVSNKLYLMADKGDFEDLPIPVSPQLHQNFPNPFNPSTTIKYNLPSSSMVSLVVYDILGRRVAELVNAQQNAGVYSVRWDGSSSLGQTVPGGFYFYRLEANSFVSTKKMLLTK